MNTYKKLTAFLLALIMLFSLAACRGKDEPEESEKPSSSEQQGENPAGSGTSDVTDEMTEPEKLPTALELLTRADELADAYTSGVQTVTNKMTMSGNPVATEVTVTKKNGNNASYKVTSDGVESEVIVLKSGVISYFSDINGAFLLKNADLDDFDLLMNGSESDMFDFANTEYYTGGTVARTESGYDVTVEISEAGKKMLAEEMGMGSDGVTFGKIEILAKIDKEGRSHEQKLNMEITMSVQGMKMTLKSEATMVFTEIGENVTIDEPKSGVTHVEFGKAEEFIAFLKADENHSSIGNGDKPFEFDRALAVSLVKAGEANMLYSKFDIFGAFDPAKGMNYSAAQTGTNVAVKYYSDFSKVIVEQGGKKYVDSTIPVENLLYTILTDIDGTNYGLSSYGATTAILQSDGGTEYIFAIVDDVSEVAASSYLANYMSYTATAVKVKKAMQVVKINSSGEYAEIGLNIEATVTIDNQNYDIVVSDKVTINSYKAATITPIVAD